MGTETMSYGVVVCPFCKREFYSEADMRNHIQKHLSNKKSNEKGGKNINIKW